MAERIRCFPPVADPDTARVLILGSMPGVASLTAQRYYAHPRNQFWPIMGALFGAGPDLPYAERLRALTRAGIALWDVLESCERAGSLDAAIDVRSAQANDFAAFFDAHPGIVRIAFNGGTAELQLIESDDPLEAGLEILARPPGKKPQTMTLLSGGEQALTAIALIFGLFLTNPAPICVLDEVDAPLDDANIDRFCDLLDSMVAETDTRYLIVTHNAVTMSRMHRLFGVTMVERGISRLVSVDLGQAELLAAE